MDVQVARRLPVGAELYRQGGVEFRVWAPARRRVEAVLADRAIELIAEPGGYYSGVDPLAKEGDLYRYRLDGEDQFPDPASRFQPQGPHGPSQIVDPSRFAWTDNGWKGASLAGQVIYEMHIGTFTPEGTWSAAMRELPTLARTGITLLEVMPVAEFPGRFGWGYDGVCLYAPAHIYGEPDDFRSFVDAAHQVGLGVILDVVYNHLGPDGNYLRQFSNAYFSSKHTTDWGEAINFDGENSGPVRQFFSFNARYWVDEYHLDGVRLDATQDIHDSSPEHLLLVLARLAREAAPHRTVVFVAENEPQEVRLITPVDQGGYGLDGLWNDDLHHSAMVALTSHNDAYYMDYLGKPQEFVSAAKRGYLYQGQRYKWQKQRRGTSALHCEPAAFVTFIQNHDQVANSASGLRCHALTSPGLYRAMTAYFLLIPGTPMLFQGQEFAASSPFLFFADHAPELGAKIREGRKEFLCQWRTLKLPEMQALLADPSSEDTFQRCKLDHSEREKHQEAYLLHCDLLRLRREDAVFSKSVRRGVDGAVLSRDAFVLRYFGGADGDRLLVVNLGRDLHLNPSPEPLLAPPSSEMEWKPIFSTEDPKYGGFGTPPPDSAANWRISGWSAVALQAFNRSKPQRKKKEKMRDE